MEEEIAIYKARKVLSLTIQVADGFGFLSGVVVNKRWSGRVSFLAKKQCGSIQEEVANCSAAVYNFFEDLQAYGSIV